MLFSPTLFNQFTFSHTPTAINESYVLCFFEQHILYFLLLFSSSPKAILFDSFRFDFFRIKYSTHFYHSQQLAHAKLKLPSAMLCPTWRRVVFAFISYIYCQCPLSKYIQKEGICKCKHLWSFVRQGSFRPVYNKLFSIQLMPAARSRSGALQAF